jgi:hypothetical protein
MNHFCADVGALNYCYRQQCSSNCDVPHSFGVEGKNVSSAVASPSVSDVYYSVCVNINFVHELVKYDRLSYGRVEELLHAFFISTLHVEWSDSLTSSLLMALIGRRLVSLTAILKILFTWFLQYTALFSIRHSLIGLCNGSKVLSVSYIYIYNANLIQSLKFNGLQSSHICRVIFLAEYYVTLYRPLVSSLPRYLLYKTCLYIQADQKSLCT